MTDIPPVPPDELSELPLDVEVLSSALAAAVPAKRARQLADRALREIGPLPTLLAASDDRLAMVGFGAAAIEILRVLGTGMRRSLGHTLANDVVDNHASAFFEYVALTRAMLKDGEVRMLLFDAAHMLTADISCRSRDVHGQMPVFQDIAAQARMAKAHAYMLVHHLPVADNRAFVNRLTTCCIAAGLVLFSPETVSIGSWPRDAAAL